MGWSPCLQASAATVILAREADKLTLGQNIKVKVPHVVTALMNSQGHKWLTNSRMICYKRLPWENKQVQLETVWMLNPATYLPTEMGTPNHNCKEVTEEIYLSRPDLMDTPLQNLELFTDGSSFIQDGQRKAGYAVMTTDEIVTAEALPQG